LKNKIGLFLFALGLSASYAHADTDYATCFQTCWDQYDACLSLGNFSSNFCGHRMSICAAMCDGWDGTGDIP